MPSFQQLTLIAPFPPQMVRSDFCSEVPCKCTQKSLYTRGPTWAEIIPFASERERIKSWVSRAMFAHPAQRQTGVQPREELPADGWGWGLLGSGSAVRVGSQSPAEEHRRARPSREHGDPWAATKQAGLAGKAATVHAGPPRAKCVELVICLPDSHVTVVKWISEGQKAFNTSLRSMKTLTHMPGARGGGGGGRA